ncbi:MAG: J domain-containing protein [Gemmatimonadetes bacterium]|nr:J domain-containing protein [Gemmatimonadota bacterium]
MKLLDYYSILGVNPSADQRAIRSAFRRLARRYHPDIAGKHAVSGFLLIREAYEVLSDPEKRRQYDRLRVQSVQVEESARRPGSVPQPGAPRRGFRLVVRLFGIRIEIGAGVG